MHIMIEMSRWWMVYLFLFSPFLFGCIYACMHLHNCRCVFLSKVVFIYLRMSSKGDILEHDWKTTENFERVTVCTCFKE